MENTSTVPVQKLLSDLHISKTSFYAFIAKNNIQVVRQTGNLSHIAERDAKTVIDYYKKKVEGGEKQTKAADLKEENTTLRKQTETLQYQIKEYAERFIDMKQRAEELKVDKEQLAVSQSEAKKEIRELWRKNATLSILVAVFGVLFAVCVAILAVFFWSK